MRWGSYFAVCSAVISIGLALGLTMPLVSLRLESWGYGSFAIGVMASTPAVGVLLGAMIAGRLAARVGTPRLMQLCLLTGAASVGLLALLQSYPVWLLLRLLIGVQLTVVFILGESWINQLAVEKWRGRLVALYGTGYALSQLSGPVLLTFIGTADDRGFWFGVCLLIAGSLLLLGRSGAPRVDPHSASGRGLWAFCRGLPAIAWAVVLFAAFEAMILTLLPVYGLRQGFPQAVALAMVSTVVVGDALLQLPIGWLADRVSRSGLFGGCGLVLLLSSLAIPLLLQTPLIWPLLVLFGASAGVVHPGADPDRRALPRRCPGPGQCPCRAAMGHRLPARPAGHRRRQPVDQRSRPAVDDGARRGGLRGAGAAARGDSGGRGGDRPGSLRVTLRASFPVRSFPRPRRSGVATGYPARGAGPGAGRRAHRSRPASAGYRCGRCAPGS